MVAVGSYFAGAHVVHIDGSYGGTGAAPDIAKKNIAMPIEYAIPKVHKFLVDEGVRDEICLIASGGVRNAMDVAKAIALGADGCVIGTADLVAVDMRALRQLRKRKRMRPRDRHHGPGTGGNDLRRVHRAAAGQSIHGLAQTVVRTAQNAGDEKYQRTQGAVPTFWSIWTTWKKRSERNTSPRPGSMCTSNKIIRYAYSQYA